MLREFEKRLLSSLILIPIAIFFIIQGSVFFIFFLSVLFLATSYEWSKMSKKNKNNINEKNLSKNLQTRNIPDPDLLIRTGNTKRLSNFLLWQIAYSEIFFEKKLWPAFNETDYNKIIKNYKKIKRNFGSI